MSVKTYQAYRQIKGIPVFRQECVNFENTLKVTYCKLLLYTLLFPDVFYFNEL